MWVEWDLGLVICNFAVKDIVKNKSLLIIVGVFLISFQVSAQEEKPKNWALGGYLKNLETVFFLGDTYFQDHLIHNRLNFRWFLSKEFTVRAEMRNRIFFGDFVKVNPTYADQVNRAGNDYLELSAILLDKKGWVIHGVFDRMFVEYIRNNWEIRLGRQRVNWGISTVWNPNDVFNAFSFTDFDYEERPGADALRVKYYTGFASSLEIASRAADSFSESTVAALWKFNTWAYDFQVLFGYVADELAFGGGWAGNLGDAGFKGELTYFNSLSTSDDEAFAATVGLDYSFSNSLYVSLGYLYNTEGGTNESVNELFTFQLSARNLYPYRHALFLQGTYPISPLLNGGMAFIYSPVEVHALFVNPTITNSLKQNWDIDFVGQLVFNQDGSSYESPVQAFFLRLKWSF